MICTTHRLLFLLSVMVIAFSPIEAHADWTQIRDLVRKADAVASKAEKENILRKACAASKESLRKSPRVSNEYLWLANAAGRLAQTVATKERIALAKVIKDNADMAIKLDPSN